MRWLRVFPGAPAQVAEVRRFVSYLLAACPARQDLVLCASELATNAIVHTASGKGGFFSVEVVRTTRGAARVLVTDAGAATVPAAGTHSTDQFDELEAGGRGLALVAACASRWGYMSSSPGHTVWVEVSWTTPATAAWGLSCGGAPGVPRLNMGGDQRDPRP